MSFSQEAEGMGGDRSKPGTRPTRLTHRSLRRAAADLGERDPDLGQVVATLGLPPLWARKPGFPTLVHIILEQQVSLASARAAYDRLLEAASPLTPERFLDLDAAELRRIGFSRQKAGYCRGLAEAIASREVDLESLGSLDDDAVRQSLMAIRGIGPWTADIYLLMALRRPDAWPSGDLALAKAAQKVKRLPYVPTIEELEAVGEAWRPWRAVAARLLWHEYLNGDSQVGSS